MRRGTIAALLLLAATGVAGHEQTPQATEQDTKTLNLSAYAELIRRDVVAQKVVIITEVMGFTEAEDAAFWPIYREYDAEMAKLGEERVAMIAEYSSTFETITDRDRREARRQGARPRDAAAGRQGGVLRPRQEGVVAAYGPPLPAGRASAPAADRPADRGLASHRP